MNVDLPAKHGSSLGAKNLSITAPSVSMRSVRKRKLEELGSNILEKRVCRRSSSREKKLLKLHGINSEVRVNLPKLNLLDTKILCPIKLSHCESDGIINNNSSTSSNNNNSNSKPKNICPDPRETNSSGNNFSGFKDILKNVRVTLDQSKIKKFLNSSHKNSEHPIKQKVLDKDDSSSTKQSVKDLDGSNKQETVKQVTPKSLFILNVDEINKKHLSNESKENIVVNNSISRGKNSPSVIGGVDFLNFKPPPIREFTLKDFGLDKDPIVSSNNENSLKKFRNSRNCDSSKEISNPTCTKDQISQETKIRKFSMTELGLNNAKVRTFGLKDFEKPSARVFGIKDFEPKKPCQMREEVQLDERKNLRSFRLDSLKDVRIKPKEKVESIVDPEVDLNDKVKTSSTSINEENSSDCQKNITTGKDSLSCDKNITTTDHKIVRSTDCSNDKVESVTESSWAKTSTGINSTAITKDTDNLDVNSASGCEKNNTVGNKNSNDNLSCELKHSDDDMHSKIGTHKLSNIFTVSVNNNSRNEIELNRNSSHKETSIVVCSSNSRDLSLFSTDSLTNNKDVSSVNTPNTEALNSNLSKNTNDAVQAVSEVSNSSIKPNIKFQESNFKGNDTPDPYVLTGNKQGVVNNIPSNINTPHSSKNDNVLNDDNAVLPEDVGIKDGGPNISVTSVSANRQASLTMEVDVMKRVSEESCSAGIRNDDNDDDEFSDGIHSDNISDGCNYDDDDDDNILESKGLSTIKSKSELEKSKSEPDKSNYEPDKSKSEQEESKSESGKNISEPEKSISEPEKSKSESEKSKLELEKSKSESEKGKSELGKSNNNNNNNLKENEKTSSEKNIINKNSSLSCNEVVLFSKISVANKNSNSNTVETVLIPSGQRPNVDDDCEIIIENCIKKTVVSSQNILKDSEDKQTEDVMEVKYSPKEKNDLNPSKRFKSSQSIREMFFPTKRNNSHPYSDVEILSDRSYRSKNFKINNSFRKNERIEDCSSEFPKFSVLDTESLMHSYKNLVCGSCYKHVDVKFTNLLNTSGAEFEVECFSCKHIRRFKRSKSCVNEVDFDATGYDNLYMKLVYSCLDFGGGYNQLQSTCLALNIPHLKKKSFEKYCSNIISQSEVKLNTVLKTVSEIVHNAYENAGISLSKEGIRDVNVFMDSWIPKGKRKKFSLVVAIDLRTGLVLDYYLKVNYCHKCFIMRKKSNFESWKSRHQNLGQCHINCSSHEDNMESEASRILCSRSEQKYKLRYTCVPSDISVTQIAANPCTNSEMENTSTEKKLETLSQNEPVLCSYENDCSKVTENKTTSLEQKETMKDINQTDKNHSEPEINNLSSSSLNGEIGKSSSTSEKISSDSCDSNGALDIQSTSSQLTLTNINSFNNGDSDKEFQELNKSLNHILEEVKIDLTFDLDNIVPSVTSSDTLSEGLLEGNGVDLLPEEEAKDISFGKIEPLSGEVLDLANQSIGEGTSAPDVTEKSTENGILMLDTSRISPENKKDSLSNDVATGVCEKSNKVDNIDFSFASSQRREEQGEGSDEKLNNSMIYDEHREMASLLASNILDQDVTTDFENSVSKENIDPNLRDAEDMLQEDTDINDKSFTSLLDEKSTVNEVSNLLVKEPVNESKAAICSVPIVEKGYQNTDSNVDSDKNKIREEEMEIDSPNKNTLLPVISEEKSQTAEKTVKSPEKNETLTHSIVAVQMTRLEKVSNLNGEEASSKSEKENPMSNVELPKLENNHCDVSSNIVENMNKILKAKKDALRSKILKNCNTSAPLPKDLIQFACNQAILLYNVNIENIISGPSNIT